MLMHRTYLHEQSIAELHRQTHYAYSVCARSTKNPLTFLLRKLPRMPFAFQYATSNTAISTSLVCYFEIT